MVIEKVPSRKMEVWFPSKPLSSHNCVRFVCFPLLLLLIISRKMPSQLSTRHICLGAFCMSPSMVLLSQLATCLLFSWPSGFVTQIPLTCLALLCTDIHPERSMSRFNPCSAIHASLRSFYSSSGMRRP